MNHMTFSASCWYTNYADLTPIVLAERHLPLLEKMTHPRILNNDIGVTMFVANVPTEFLNEDGIPKARPLKNEVVLSGLRAPVVFEVGSVSESFYKKLNKLHPRLFVTYGPDTMSEVNYTQSRAYVTHSQLVAHGYQLFWHKRYLGFNTIGETHQRFQKHHFKLLSVMERIFRHRHTFTFSIVVPMGATNNDEFADTRKVNVGGKTVIHFYIPKLPLDFVNKVVDEYPEYFVRQDTEDLAINPKVEAMEAATFRVQVGSRVVPSEVKIPKYLIPQQEVSFSIRSKSLEG